MKKLSFLIVVVLFFTFTNQMNVSAYSYGDPNKEEIAEVYKQMVVKLNQSPPDYAVAEELFLTIKEEIDMHMGEEASQFVLEPLKDKDKEAAIENMEKLLALNISRRLEAIENNFEEYDTSKKLLAKGFATYEALSPSVREADLELDEEIKKQFDLALEALGNPGLFGVGEAEQDLEKFQQSKQAILDSLKGHFDIEGYDVGHFTKSETEQELEDEQVSSAPKYTDYSEWKNWLPLLIIALVIAATAFYFIRKKK